MYNQNNEPQDGKQTTIENVKKGSTFKLIGSKRVLVKGDYNRSLRKYEYYSWNDINQFGHRRKGTPVIIDFTF